MSRFPKSARTEGAIIVFFIIFFVMLRHTAVCRVVVHVKLSYLKQTGKFLMVEIMSSCYRETA
jgi:hypothetical protein